MLFPILLENDPHGTDEELKLTVVKYLVPNHIAHQ